MAGIIWLASYPKSGNTWLRALLTNYLSDRTEPASINELVGGPIASDRHTFDEITGIESSDFSSREISEMRSTAARVMALQSREQRLFIKAHDARQFDNIDLFPADVTAGALYMVRHPFDVALSLANHLDCSLELAVERLCTGLTLAQQGPRLRDQLEQVALSWAEHVRTWTAAPPFPCHVIRYEDLLASPESTLEGALNAVGITIERQKLARAVRFSSFGELKSQETRGGFSERHSRQAPFFRTGQSGHGRGALSVVLQERVIEACGSTLCQLGYH